ncbi:plasmid pRiA4b ORF-3 family protein [Bacillus salacetis]|uniref:plasmid pRiA4b ORF-3 family protein n=1 Tax=Bacillus salacetis TaxID=2315464 RepID=UPI003B9E514A
MELKSIIGNIIKDSEKFRQLNAAKLTKSVEIDYTAPTNGYVYQLKVSLKRAKPPIWRRIVVQDRITLHQLHRIIQTAMGWTDLSSYDFHLGNVIFEPELIEEEDFGLPNFREAHDSSKVLLGNVLQKEGQKLNYTYDFRNNWEHHVELEKILDEQVVSPRCLKGKRAAPPEGIRGIDHYLRMLERLKDSGPDDEEINFYREILEGLDPEHFDLDETNHLLQEMVLE